MENVQKPKLFEKFRLRFRTNKSKNLLRILVGYLCDPGERGPIANYEHIAIGNNPMLYLRYCPVTKQLKVNTHVIIQKTKAQVISDPSIKQPQFALRIMQEAAN